MKFYLETSSLCSLIVSTQNMAHLLRQTFVQLLLTTGKAFWERTESDWEICDPHPPGY